MSRLSELASSVDGKPPKGTWPTFLQPFPVKISEVRDPTPDGTLNEKIETAIREQGDKYKNSTEAQCLMTRWDMHDLYESVALIGQAACDVARMVPLGRRTTPEGVPENVPLSVTESWGLIYTKGSRTGNHTHWPSLWSFCYTVKANDCCSPFILGDLRQRVELPKGIGLDDVEGVLEPKEDMTVHPKTGQLVVWPAWLMHYVPEMTCDCDRIKIAGNIDRCDFITSKPQTGPDRRAYGSGQHIYGEPVDTILDAGDVHPVTE